MASSDRSNSPKRKRRVTRACDQCHRSNRKCAPGPTVSQCVQCHDFGCACTYERPVLRRGPRSGKGRANAPRRAERGLQVSPPEAELHPVWTAKLIAPSNVIEELAESYHSIVYPIFPLFHWPSFLLRLHDAEYTGDRAFYISTMTLCAIVTARFRNGAISLPLPSSNAPASERFAMAAIEAFPRNLAEARGFEYLRAKALLAILHIQYGNTLEHRTQLGEYIVLASNDGFADETRWPMDISAEEQQERRRLFWSVYTLEIYSAITWGGMIRLREQQSNVRYPVELDDEMIPLHPDSTTPHSVTFMSGWNFTTDMYRMLEHLVDRLRTTKPIDPTQASLVDLFQLPSPSPKDVLDRLDYLYDQLPDVFKSVGQMTGDPKLDIFGFQAANIILTMQTVRLTVAAVAEDQGVESRCKFASDLVNALKTIPTPFIAAVSRPMLHHLASCGHLLGGLVNRPLTAKALLQVRSILVSMVDILSALEFTFSFPADISTHLRTHVSLVDGYIERASRHGSRAASPHVTGGSPSHPTFNPFEDIDLSPSYTFKLPQDFQIQMQSDLTADWPSDLGSSLFGLLDGTNWDVSSPVS